jgi:hypothetical protein
MSLPSPVGVGVGVGEGFAVGAIGCVVGALPTNGLESG